MRRNSSRMIAARNRSVRSVWHRRHTTSLAEADKAHDLEKPDECQPLLRRQRHKLSERMVFLHGLQPGEQGSSRLCTKSSLLATNMTGLVLDSAKTLGNHQARNDRPQPGRAPRPHRPKRGLNGLVQIGSGPPCARGVPGLKPRRPQTRTARRPGGTNAGDAMPSGLCLARSDRYLCPTNAFNKVDFAHVRRLMIDHHAKGCFAQAQLPSAPPFCAPRGQIGQHLIQRWIEFIARCNWLCPRATSPRNSVPGNRQLCAQPRGLTSASASLFESTFAAACSAARRESPHPAQNQQHLDIQPPQNCQVLCLGSFGTAIVALPSCAPCSHSCKAVLASLSAFQGGLGHHRLK